jgi:hypothetical protein
MQEVEHWLAKLGMSEYAERFAENRIDFTVLPDLTDQDLKDIGVVLGDRRKILRAIAKLDAAPEAVVLDLKPPSTLSVAAVQGLLIEAEAHERRDVTLDEIVRDRRRTSTTATIGCRPCREGLERCGARCDLRACAQGLDRAFALQRPGSRRLSLRRFALNAIPRSKLKRGQVANAD